MSNNSNSSYPCEECKGQCCNHVALEIDEPTTKKDYDHIKWYLLHKNVEIFIDHEEDWYIKFYSPCEKQDSNYLCTIYDERPDICREYPDADSYCEYEGEDEYYTQLFKNTSDLEKYLESKKA